MNELMRWLGEQLDRDRDLARAAQRQIGDDWNIGDEPYGFIMSDGDVVAYYEEGGGDQAMSRAAAVHAAAHDPARVLREIDAKRATLRECEETAARMDQAMSDGDEVAYSLARTEHRALSRIARRDAAVYADRPGYREAWRP